MKWNATTMRRTSKVFVAIQVLHKYKEQNNVSLIQGESALSSLAEFKKKYMEQEGLPATFLDDNLLQQIASWDGAELSPVAAILGGLLGQEIIKVLGGKDEPLHNFFLYHGLDGSGLVEQIEGSATTTL
eukprot:TRINITY_DN3259_c0_g1_i2.p1 TRINITY_DN3259_c0_g1~~TRINITY_DN3259_c0_g1_i2.p1  ORF type:complete len:129 (-),score=41.41 TRINITY_DN3259_c0_g1_i2:68-454(-)